MRFLLSFTKEDMARLYLTYHRNPENYAKIKEKILGERAKLDFRKDIRGRFIFLIGVTIIAIISMLYPAAVGDWRTVGALGAIWGLFMVAFGVWIYLSYRFSFRILQKNTDFINLFEKSVNNYDSVNEFIKDWGTNN